MLVPCPLAIYVGGYITIRPAPYSRCIMNKYKAIIVGKTTETDGTMNFSIDVNYTRASKPTYIKDFSSACAEIFSGFFVERPRPVYFISPSNVFETTALVQRMIDKFLEILPEQLEKYTTELGSCSFDTLSDCKKRLGADSGDK